MNSDKLVRQFVQVQSKLEPTEHAASDEAFAVRHMTNGSTLLGVGSNTIKKNLMDEAKRLKPDSFGAYFDGILKTQYETRKAVP